MNKVLFTVLALVLALSLALPMAASVGASPGPGLVGLWHLDGNANDSSGNNNHGTVYGATYVAGKFGQALIFDGIDDYVNVPHDTTLNPTSAITVECWAKLDRVDVHQVLVRKMNTYSLQVTVGLNGAGARLEGWVKIGGTWKGVRGVAGGTPLESNRWYHFAFTYDGAQVTTYVNGVADRSNGVTGAIDSTTNPLNIGRCGPPEKSYCYADGLIDEVRIWDEAIMPPTTVPLCAGQSIYAGVVTVWNDSDDLYVMYMTSGDWVMTETHLAIVTDPAEFPTTKKGNPKVGLFPDGDDYDPPVSEDTFTFSLEDEGWAACTNLYIAAHAVVIAPIDDCYETVWQIGDVEPIDPETGQPTKYYDEFNYQGPVGHVYPAYTDPFVVDTTPDSEFPWISNYSRGYATDFRVQWDRELWFGGELTISWSPGLSGRETVIITSIDGGETETFVVSGSTDPNGWQGYPLVESTLALDPLEEGGHEFRFQNTSGNGLLWDWVRLDKPCEQEETAWGDGCGGASFPGNNWATYFTYDVQHVVLGDWSVVYTRYHPGPGGPWTHAMSIDTQNPDGTFTGTGTYPPTPTYIWTYSVSGDLTCDTVSMTLTYNEASITMSLTGTVVNGNTMTGTAVQSGLGGGQEYNWIATRVP